MNQSQLEAQARENACEQITMGADKFELLFESGANFFKPIGGCSKPNQSKREITFDTMKT